MELLLKYGRIFDVYAEESYPADILCEDERIVRIGSDLKPPVGCNVLNCSHKLIVPGLFNCHTHIAYNMDYPGRKQRYPFYTNEDSHEINPAYRAAVSVYLLRQMLKSGVTFIRNVGDRNYIDIGLRDALNDYENTHLTGPDMMCAGKCIIMTGGHGWCDKGLSIEADGPDAVRKAAREQFKNGADMLKLMTTGGIMTPNVNPLHSQFTIEEIRAAVDEAHCIGRIVATHSQGSTGVKNALRAGVDSIEHGNNMDEECIQMMIDQKTYYTPTLCAPEGILADPHCPQFMKDKAADAIDALNHSVQMAYDAKVNIVCGTDTGTPSNGYGNTGHELVLMTRLGIPMAYALKAATLTSANLCRVADTRGSITEGKYADLAVFDEDLLDTPELIMKCYATIKHGVAYTSKHFL